MNNKFTFIDLFAGIGGFRLALDSIGGECVNFSEINNDAINSYCENFEENKLNNLGDITKIESLPQHDLLTGGVPCQSWSIAGKNLGFDDDRGQLWNDTICLLNQSRPKAFIFENVKGLVDPRNKNALQYIMNRIREAGYYAKHYLINSYDYGVPQNRMRIYIVGFKEKEFYDNFTLPKPIINKTQLGDILNGYKPPIEVVKELNKNLFGDLIMPRSMSLSSNNGVNDYFLFNDLRNGHSTIHSWDILETTQRQKDICYLLLKNRRKSNFGSLDGNPLSLLHFKDFDKTIVQSEIDELVALDIFKIEKYAFTIVENDKIKLDEDEIELLKTKNNDRIFLDILKTDRNLKLKKISLTKTLKKLEDKKIIICNELRYDFKNSKISTGLFGVNRIFLPTSNIFPTLVASDTNDFITLSKIEFTNEKEFKENFLKNIYLKNDFRKITKEEACRIQGFPEDYILPENRPRWMKLLGNSVSVPVIEMIGKAILKTGVFENNLTNIKAS